LIVQQQQPQQYHGSSVRRFCTAQSSAPSPLQQHNNRSRILGEGGAGAADTACSRTRRNEVQMTLECRTMIDAAIEAVDPVTAVHRHVQAAIPTTTTSTTKQQQKLLCIGGKLYELHKYDRVIVTAFGKASAAMATAVLDRLLEAAAADSGANTGSKSSSSTDTATAVTNKIKGGVVIVKDGHATAEQIRYLGRHNIAVREASHPVPDARSVQASEELLNLFLDDDTNADGAAGPATLVFACISGGGSALFCSPLGNLTLSDLQATNAALLRSGWDIQDMNVIRKRLERGKGGGLVKAAAAAASSKMGTTTDFVSLILSDVVGDPLDLIASGPTVADTSTPADAWRLIQEKAHVELPERVYSLLQEGGASNDRPIESDKDLFARCCHNVLVGSNAQAVRAAADTARQLGYHPIVLGTQVLRGEASTVAQVLVGVAQHLRHHDDDAQYKLTRRFPVALIAGGETTVTLPPADSTGRGGRNQELALAGALALDSLGLRNVVLACAGTDGSDGPTDAAGAIVDGGTVQRLRQQPVSAKVALKDHDAYAYLEQLDENGHSPLLKVCQNLQRETFSELHGCFELEKS
jgi:glycerate 2-kinase